MSTHLRCCFLGRKHYLHAGAIQEHLVRQQLAHKAAVAAATAAASLRPPPSTTGIASGSRDASDSADGSTTAPAARPPPTLLLFEAHPPVYTCGRRDMASLPADLISYLRSPPPPSTPNSFFRGNKQSPVDKREERDTGAAEFYESPRGGQITFHGAGQLTAYLICDLRAHRLTPRCHVRLLEHTVQATLRRYGLSTVLYEDFPGVWVARAKESPQRGGEGEMSDQSRLVTHPAVPLFPSSTASPSPPPDSRKISSVGVHVRRHVTSFGVAINARPNLAYFHRITACGLPGTLATSILAEGGARWPLPMTEVEGKDREEGLLMGEGQEGEGKGGDGPALSVSALGNVYADALAKELNGVEGIQKVAEDELWDGGSAMQDWVDRFQARGVSGAAPATAAAVEMDGPPFPTGSAMWKSR